MSRLTGISLAIWSAFAALIVINVMLVTSNLQVTESDNVPDADVRSADVEEGYLTSYGAAEGNSGRDVRRGSERLSSLEDERYRRLESMLEAQEARYRDLLTRYQILADHIGLGSQSPESFPAIEMLPLQLAALTRRPAASGEPTGTATAAEEGGLDTNLVQRVTELEAELQLEMQLNNLLQQELESLRAAQAAAQTPSGESAGTTQPPADTNLLDPMDDVETEFADAMADQFTRLGGDAVPALNRLLQHRAPRIREWAANVVTDIGPDAASTRQTLIGLREDGDAYVRAAAERALMSIDGQPPE